MAIVYYPSQGTSNKQYFLKSFHLLSSENGLILQLPTMTHPDAIVKNKTMNNLIDVLKETIKWRKILDLEDVGMLNSYIEKGKYHDFVLLAEDGPEIALLHLARTVLAGLDGRLIHGDDTGSADRGQQRLVNGFEQGRTLLCQLGEPGPADGEAGVQQAA